VPPSGDVATLEGASAGVTGSGALAHDDAVRMNDRNEIINRLLIEHRDAIDRLSST
jgi:hypothetical protein